MKIILTDKTCTYHKPLLTQDIFFAIIQCFCRGKCDANLRLGLQKHVILLSVWMWRNHAHRLSWNYRMNCRLSHKHTQPDTCLKRVQVRRIWYYRVHMCLDVSHRECWQTETEGERQSQTLQSFPLLLTATETQNSLCRWIFVIIPNIYYSMYITALE